MTNFKNEPLSYWLDSTKKTNYPSLNQNIEVDVCIIGGGISGVTSAFMLKRKGLNVALLEVDNILEGTTARTTAKITSQHGLIYKKLIDQVGENKAKQYIDANETAIKFIKNIVKEKNIDCDFKELPAYVYASTDEYIKKIKDEVDASKKLGMNSTFVENLDLPFDVKGAIRFENQAQFHPRKYLLELADEVDGNGSYIFENTKVIDIQDGDIVKIITSNENIISAKKVVIATHFPIENFRALYFSRIYTERSYILGALIKDNLPEGMYISAEKPTRSLRYQDYNGRKMLLIGGDGHKTGQGEDTEIHYENLKNFAKENFDIEDIPYRWSTQDCMPIDDIPFIGKITRNSENIFLSTGFKKWGMTNATASAMILTDLITNIKNPYSEVFNPSRFNIKGSLSTFLKKNLNVGYEFIKGKLKTENIDIEVATGEGKVVNLNGRRVGFYKHNDGRTYIVDTTCTHLGCELSWNNAEKSWDCPCHGSRFSFDGTIMEGPALQRLKVKIIED